MHPAQPRGKVRGLLGDPEDAVGVSQHVASHRHVNDARGRSDHGGRGRDETRAVLGMNDRKPRLTGRTDPDEAHREETRVNTDDVDVLTRQETRDSTGRPGGGEANDVGDGKVSAVRANIDLLLRAMAGFVGDGEDEHSMPQLSQGHRQVVDVGL